MSMLNETIQLPTAELSKIIELIQLKLRVLELQSRTFRYSSKDETLAVQRAIADLIVTLFAYFKKSDAISIS